MSAALDHLCLMARNNAWANERLLGACLALSQAEFEAERSGFFPSISQTLNHNLSVDRYYLDAVTESGKGRAVYDEKPAQTVAVLLREQADQDRALTAFCQALTTDNLSQTVMQDRGSHGVFSERIDHTLLHLFQHQTHHRGQAHAMLSSTQIAPPQLDEFFIEFDRHPTAQKMF